MKNNIQKPLLDILFPIYCISCGREKEYLCEDCIALIPINRQIDIFPSSNPLSGLFYASSYDDIRIQRAIKYLKYPPFAKSIAKQLALIIISHLTLLDKLPNSISFSSFSTDSELSTQYDKFFLCPIPLHPKRLRWRGFNHAEEIAHYTSGVFSMPIITNILKRKIYTTPQADLSKEKRLANMHDAFEISNPETIQEKTIFLIDDVFTTGATMREAAQTLKCAGASRVWGIAVARG